MVALDARLGTEGGVARFGMDDGYLCGPPALVWLAVVDFARDLREATGCEMQFNKMKGFSEAGEAAFVGAPAGVERGQDEAGNYGVQVFNIPFGDPEFVAADMRRRGTEVDGIHQLYAQKLHLLDPALLWCFAQLSLQHRPIYWLRNMPPAEVVEYCAIVDKALLRTASSALGFQLPEGSLAQRRLRLPASLKGGGLRSAAATSPAAYLGALGELLPSFVNHYGREGESVPGVYHQHLGGVIGEASFHAGGGGYETFVESGLRVAASMLKAHLELRHVVQHLPGVHLLSQPLAGMVATACRQKSFTALLDDVEGQAVSQAFLAQRFHATLPHLHREAVLFQQLDSFSSAWVTAVPAGDVQCTAQEFREVGAAYFLQPSPSLAGRVGLTIRLPGAPLCDPFGDKLSAAALTGVGPGTWYGQHDACKTALHQAAVTAGVCSKMEVAGLFNHLLPLAADGTNRLMAAIPDVVAYMPLPPGGAGGLVVGEGATVGHLGEVKTLHYSSANYDTGRKAVDRRARKVAADRDRTLRGLDERYFQAPEGAVGPLRQWLSGFPFYQFVFGCVGEASEDVGHFLDHLAAHGANRYGVQIGAFSREIARAALGRMLRRRVALVALRARAAFLLGRLEHVGPMVQGLGGDGAA